MNPESRFLTSFYKHVLLAKQTNFGRSAIASASRARKDFEQFNRALQKMVSFAHMPRHVHLLSREYRPRTVPVFAESRPNLPSPPAENVPLVPGWNALALRTDQSLVRPRLRRAKSSRDIAEDAVSHLVGIAAALASLESGVFVDRAFFEGLRENISTVDPDTAHNAYAAIVELQPAPREVYRAMNHVGAGSEPILESIVRQVTTSPLRRQGRKDYMPSRLFSYRESRR